MPTQIHDISWLPQSMQGVTYNRTLRDTHKEWQFDIVNQNAGDLVVSMKGTHTADPNAVNVNGLYEGSVWNEVYHYMTNVISPKGGSDLFYGNSLVSGSTIRVIDVPRQVYGTIVQKNSIRVAHDTVLLTDTLLVSSNTNTTYPETLGVLLSGSTEVGFVVYDYGLIVITSQQVQDDYPDIGLTDTNVRFNSSVPIVEHVVNCQVDTSKFTKTTNPSGIESQSTEFVYYPIILFSSGSAADPNIVVNYFYAQYPALKIDRVESGTEIYYLTTDNARVLFGTLDGDILYNNDTTAKRLYTKEAVPTYATPKYAYFKLSANTIKYNEYSTLFTTAIGLYNSNGELVGVAKPPKPLPLYKEIDLNINIKFDTRG
jgi:hypothetical protein